MVVTSSVVATHIALLSGKQCVAPFASLGQAHWSPSAVVGGDGGGGRCCWFLFVVDREGGVGMGWIDGDGPLWVVSAVLWLFAGLVVAQSFRWLLS